jgi:GMP synthase (glutamine-hydrolysing)
VNTELNILAIMPGGMQGVEETGVIGEVVQRRGAALDWRFRLKGDSFPGSSDDYDGLIVFGGEIGAHEPQYAGYFNDLYKLIRAFHNEEKPVFGSCLGAQSIACAFGGESKPQGFFEFGFVELTAEPAARTDPLLSFAPPAISLFEMHYDTFVLPEGAVRLLRGEAVPNQAFRIGTKTYGFQCHFEATSDIVRLWRQRELVNNPRHSEDEIASLSKRIDLEFEELGAAQQDFGLKVMNRWMDLFA